MALEKEKLLELYRKMLMVRAIEEKHAELLASGRVQLMSHFGTGQEAVSVGVSGCLRREDILFGTHRGVGEYIGKGMTPKDIWAEYLGKTNGPCKGKGTLHLASKTVNIPGLVSSLGSDFSIAVGTALQSCGNLIRPPYILWGREPAIREISDLLSIWPRYTTCRSYSPYAPISFASFPTCTNTSKPRT